MLQMDALFTATRVCDPPPGAILSAPDYWDCFRVPAGAFTERPRAWASAALAGADGLFGSLVWSGLLGFDLAPSGTPRTLGGWTVETDTSTTLGLTADGGRMSGRMDFSRVGDHMAWTTMLVFHGRVGAAIWAVAGPVHRQLAPRCLEHAQRRLGGTSR